MPKSNVECALSNKFGYGCSVLIETDDGCLNGTCPFYRTEHDIRMSETKDKARCNMLGIRFRSRADVLSEVEYKAKYDKRRRKPKEDKEIVLQYNTIEYSFTEYDFIESACKAVGISRERLETLIRKGKEYKGYKFTKI